MASQAEKWEVRKKKTEELKKQNADKQKKKGTDPMSDNKWNEQLKSSDEYKKAVLLGVNMDGFSADSQEKLNEKIELLKKKIEEIEQALEQQEEKSEQQEEQKSEQEQQEKQPEQQEEKPQEKNQNETMEVGSIDDGPKTDDLAWIKEKREFYSKYAQDIDSVFKNDEEKDLSEKSFTFSLEKNGKSLGEIKYTSPTSVQISKDAQIDMYKGIINDALKNNLRLSFGKSLNDTQKAMLMTAVLLNKQNTYDDGSSIVLENVPSIDTKAEYFKELPKNVQDVLKDWASKQTQNNDTNKEAFNGKIKELRAKIKQKAEDEDKQTKKLTTEEYRAAMLDGMSDEDKKLRQAKIEEREKTLAARLGIIKHSVINKDGKKTEIKESKATKDLITEQNPGLINVLTNKYGKGK